MIKTLTSTNQHHSASPSFKGNQILPSTLGHIDLADGLQNPFQIAPDDLNEHFYILGRSGTGKSNLLKQIALNDAKRRAGLCFIDPIGTTADELAVQLSRQSRTSDRVGSGQDASKNDKDIIYIDMADVDWPIGINPLYNIAPEDRAKTVSDILHMFAGIWYETGWGPRMESIFRAVLHTLVENPQMMRPSLLTAFRLLLDEQFRDHTKSDLGNQHLLDWWSYRFDRGDLNERTRREWVEPVLNKIDTLSLDPVIRNIIGQPRCTLDFEEIVRRKQCLIINLNQNKIGHDNAAFIGILILSRIRQAAAKVGRPDQPFALTLDEAHSFPTTELTKVINQGRHSGLFARIAHQNLEQFDPKIAAGLRNGCGSLCIFASGSRDAEVIVNDLDLMHRDRCLAMINSLERGQCLMRLTQRGTPQAPSAYPISVSFERTSAFKSDKTTLEGVKRLTQERFATSKLTAEFQIISAHNQLTPEELSVWKARFRNERKERASQHRGHTRIKQANRQRVKEKAFGGAALELERLADEVFGNATHEPSNGNHGVEANSQNP